LLLSAAWGAFGKPLIDHEGVGFMLADNLIDLKQSELMIDWCAGVLDAGSLATAESSMAKVAVSEALMRVADFSVKLQRRGNPWNLPSS
jgi:acyl-CoA dehydrogenase